MLSIREKSGIGLRSIRITYPTKWSSEIERVRGSVESCFHCSWLVPGIPGTLWRMGLSL